MAEMSIPPPLPEAEPASAAIPVAAPVAEAPPLPLGTIQADVRWLGATEGPGRWLAGLIGAALGVFVTLILYFFLPPQSALRKIFDIRRFETIIPVVIAAAFFWGILYCFLRRLHLRAARRACSPVLLAQVRAAIRSHGAAATLASMDPVSAQRSPLLRRVKAAVEQWLTSGSVQDVDMVLQQHVTHDEEEMHQGYTLVRLFVWALPVLGLIGTVIGISLAVGGFSNFLASSIDDVAEIKRNLVTVTSGLAFAFLITLEGLATSLLLMFYSSALQTAEGRLYLQLQKRIADDFLPALQQVPSPARRSADDEAGKAALQAWREQLIGTGQAVMLAVRNTAVKLVRGTDAHEQVRQQQYDKWTKEISLQLRGSALLLTEALDKNTAFMGQVYERMNRDGQALGDALTQQRESFARMLQTHEAEVRQAQQQMIAALDKQAGEVSANGLALQQVAEATRALAEAQQGMTEAVHQIQKSGMLRDVETLVTAMGAQSRQLESMVGTVRALNDGTQELVESHKALHTATCQLRDTGLTETLSSVRDSLNSVVPVLEGFQRPFVLRAVPVTENPGKQAGEA